MTVRSKSAENTAEHRNGLCLGRDEAWGGASIRHCWNSPQLPSNVFLCFRSSSPASGCFFFYCPRVRLLSDAPLATRAVSPAKAERRRRPGKFSAPITVSQWLIRAGAWKSNPCLHNSYSRVSFGIRRKLLSRGLCLNRHCCLTHLLPLSHFPQSRAEIWEIQPKIVSDMSKCKGDQKWRTQVQGVMQKKPTFKRMLMAAHSMQSYNGAKRVNVVFKLDWVLW